MKLNPSPSLSRKPIIWQFNGILYTTSLNISKVCKIPQYKITKNIENLIICNKFSHCFKKDDLETLSYNVSKEGIVCLFPKLMNNYQKFIKIYAEAFDKAILQNVSQKEEASQI